MWIHAYTGMYLHFRFPYKKSFWSKLFGNKVAVYSITHIKVFYRKNSKNWDTLNYYPDCPTNVIVGFYSAILRSKDADRITNRVDTDQTAP